VEHPVRATFLCFKLGGLTYGTKREHYPASNNPEAVMPQDAAPNPRAGADRLEAATDQAIAACGGGAREAVRALIVANEFLEALVEELHADVSKGYARGYNYGRFKTYTG
jgi:hypothetical protein